jgi:hypothetical protein
MTDYQLATAFQSYLLPGERVLWTGRPTQGFALRPLDAFLIPFSVLWCGFVVFWNVEVWSAGGEGAPPVFDIFGFVFLLIGLYFLIGRFIHDAAIRRRTSYALTNQRALFQRGSKLTSLDLHHLPKLELNERGDGTGTIAFQDGPGFMSYGEYSGLDWWVPSMVASSSFFGIDRARDVYRTIKEHSGRSLTF